KKLADDLEKGKLAKYRLFRELMNLQYADIAPLWGKLTALCYRLEALAHKQLRKAPFNVDESRFLKEYGVQLAAVMLHAGNAYISPKDDAPRVADVFSDPLNRRYLEIGIGRARAFYVLYPDNDREILCRGTVLPYYEFGYAQRLDDAEWKALLDSEKRPDLPAWVKPILATSAAAPTKSEK